ncbi:META domain-containing protein [Hymenobacter sp. 5516J-16]|uniref:META domain-containing protein n=1 Tax=Hymenobacter sp. 5516J-16 TaxID=2932253 RepID=UPI001FD29737|nr:META domain-containing protein [Hymenobacter sp. 5516J-16]UOQ78688.1 META domain-containing protein [Hymenobacter sp. 5516J-16]
MRTAFLVACVASLGMLGSCQDKESSGKPVLTGTRWMLVQVEDTPLSISSYSDTYRSYLQFTENNRTEGLGPCNSFGGTYTLGASGGTLRISEQAATRINCAALGIETLYLNALPRTVSYEVKDRELRLFDASNSLKPLLLFRAAE